MQSANVDAKFVYNENGLRVQKTVNGVATKYTLHGKNIVHMTSGADELHIFYDAQNRPAVVVYNDVPYAYVKNLQGDVIAILDAAGNVVVSYVYDAWGAPIGKSGSMAETLGKVQPFRYRGYVFDEETGLYYLRSRYYNPRWGRFVNADQLITTNLFAYCNNSPIYYCDPNGKECETCEQGGATSYEVYTLNRNEYRFLITMMDAMYPLDSVPTPIEQVLGNLVGDLTETSIEKIADELDFYSPILLKDFYENVIDPYVQYDKEFGTYITNRLARDGIIEEPDEVKIILSFSSGKNEIGLIYSKDGCVISKRSETASRITMWAIYNAMDGRFRHQHGHFGDSREALEDVIQRIEKE